MPAASCAEPRSKHSHCRAVVAGRRAVIGLTLASLAWTDEDAALAPCRPPKIGT